VTVSRFGQGFEPSRAVDGNLETWWGASAPPPQWIQVDLGAPATIAAIRLTVSQSPSGPTVHRILAKGPEANSPFVLLQELRGETNDLDVLSYTPPEPLENIQFVRVETISSPSWVSWREVEVIAAK
jgi:hypothetical protein